MNFTNAAGRLARLFAAPPPPPQACGFDARPDTLILIGLGTQVVLLFGAVFDHLEVDDDQDSHQEAAPEEDVDNLAHRHPSVYECLIQAWQHVKLCRKWVSDANAPLATQCVTLALGVASYGLAFLCTPGFSLDSANHLALSSLAFLVACRHATRLVLADTPRVAKSMNAMCALPLVTLVASMYEKVATTSCQAVNLFSLTLAFIPLLVSIRILRARGDKRREKRRLFTLMVTFFVFVAVAFPKTVCHPNEWSPDEKRMLNLVFDTIVAVCVSDAVWLCS